MRRKPKGLTRRFIIPVVLYLAIALVWAPTTLAWGWWYVGSIVAGAAVCVATGGIGVPVVAGMAVGSIGTVGVGDSVYDQIAAAASSPVGGELVVEKANPAPIVLPPITDAQTPQATLDKLNVGRQHLADSLQAARGMLESAKRFYGAKEAGDIAAMNLQRGYVLEFLSSNEDSSNLGLDALRDYGLDFRSLAPESDENRTTADEYKAFRDAVVMDGCPECLEYACIQLDVTPEELIDVESYITSATDGEIDEFFAQYPAAGVYFPDFLDEALRQWEAQPMRSALSSELVPEPSCLLLVTIGILALGALARRDLATPIIKER